MQSIFIAIVLQELDLLRTRKAFLNEIQQILNEGNLNNKLNKDSSELALLLGTCYDFNSNILEMI